MQNLELISYTEYPHDQYTKAIVTIRMDGKHIVSYAQKMSKDGKVFWAPATINVVDSQNQKQYIEGYLLDSRGDELKLMEFIKESAKKVQYAQSLGNPLPAKAEAVAGQNNEPLPF